MRQVTERLNFRDFDTVGLKSDWQARRKAEYDALVTFLQGECQGSGHSLRRTEKSFPFGD